MQIKSRKEQLTNGKRKAKGYTREEAIDFLKGYPSGRSLTAMYRRGGEYLCIRKKNAPVLYELAEDMGHKDPDFIGFYGGILGWFYFGEDTAVEVAA